MTKQNQPPPYAEFGERFKQLLDKKAEGNLSACARAMGNTPQAVSKWAAGMQIPRGDQMVKLAAWLGSTPGHLRFGEAAPAPKPKFILMWIEAEREVPLLNDFRLGTDRGQKQLLSAAKRMEKVPPQDQPPAPASSEY